MEKYLFFNSTQTDRRKHQASDIADYWQSFLRSGVITQDNDIALKVVAKTNRKVGLNNGRALIFGHLYVQEDTELTIPEPHATLNRIDRIVLRFDNTIENRYIKAFVIRGVASSTPTAPELTRNNEVHEISLAKINVTAGKSTVVQADIVDERLNEAVCGIASSLVSVPTDIYNERFSEYMQQIANDWQTWFNRVVNDTYITNTQFNTRNRQVDRQLANLNAIADIDNRAVGSTGKFYDLFDGSNDKSVAMLDKSLGIINDNTVANNSSFYYLGNAQFKKGDEITILGLETALSNTPTIIHRVITAIEANLITLDKPLDVSLLAGAIICRSLVDEKGEITDELRLDGWANAAMDSTKLYTDTGVTILSSGMTKAGYKLLAVGTAHVLKMNDDGTFNKITSLGGSSGFGETYTFTPDGKFIMCPKGSSSWMYTQCEMQLVDIDATTKLTNYNLPNYTWRDTNDGFNATIALNHLRYFVKNNKSHMTWVSKRSTGAVLSIYQFDDDNKIWSVVATITNINLSSLVSIRLVNNNDDLLLFNSNGIMHYTINYANKTIVYKTSYAVSGISSSSTINTCIVNNAQDRVVVFGTVKTLLILDKTTGIFTMKTDILQTLPTTTNAYFTKNDAYLIIGSSVYGFANENFALVKNNITANSIIQSPWGVYYTTLTSSNIYKINATTILKVPFILRYRFTQSLKNLAGWLVTKTAPSNVQASLSLVDNTQNESYKTLTVTKKDNEYEFLETANTVPKDKVTLKLSVNGGSLEKLLGAIE